jgi:Domain of unknown function (DUF4249)
MKTKVLIYFPLIISCIASCVTPIKDFEQVSSSEFLTVEATLTDQNEQQSISLSYSNGDINNSFFKPVQRAEVYILDEKNKKEIFTESYPDGKYVASPTFRGKIGSTYTLFIQANGRRYTSNPETMRAVPEIENLISRYELNDNYPKGNPLRGGFNVYLDFQDPKTVGDYYSWHWKHYERVFICATELTREGELFYSCSSDCWDISYSKDLNIFSDGYLNGKRITGKQVARIPFDSFNPYYFLLEQRSNTKSSYTYYQSLAVQTQNTGSLFDIPAETRFNFNIKSSDAKDKVLGLFDVYSVKKKLFYIDRKSNIPKGEFPIINVNSGKPACPAFPCPKPCLESRFRTGMKPEGWKE